MRRFFEAVLSAGVLLLLATAVTGCASLSTQIAERDESRKDIKLSPGQEVVVLMPKAMDSEALETVLQDSDFTTESYMQALQQALLEELESRGVHAVAGEGREGNTLQIVVTELKRKSKFLGLAGENEATLRTSSILVVEGHRREFESETRQKPTSSTEVVGIEVSHSDPVKLIVKTCAIGIASAVVM
jgi:hypothetical protein